MEVPCRKCPNCQRQISLEYVMRIQHEHEMHNYEGYFVTLTYDDYYSKYFELGVNKCDVQKFLKRLRKHVNKKIKYFACGEYGEIEGRAHYHLILIGLNNNDRDSIEKSWLFGITDIKPLNYATIKYVVDYLHKDVIPETLNNRHLPFTLKSKGLGKDWFNKYKNEIIEDKCIICDGYKRSIPRYYLKLLKKSNPDFYEYLLEKAPDEAPFKFIRKEDWEYDHAEKEEERSRQRAHNANIATLRRLNN